MMNYLKKTDKRALALFPAGTVVKDLPWAGVEHAQSILA